MHFLRSDPRTKLLMVCMGNICRSPMAQVVTLHLADKAGLGRDLQVDSAGTHAVKGSLPADPRARSALSGRGYQPGKCRSRQVKDGDFVRYDLILAMDQENMNDLRRLCPSEHTHKLRMFMEYAQDVDQLEMPDPYYGNLQGFERVLDLCESGASGLIAHCQAELRQA